MARPEQVAPKLHVPPQTISYDLRVCGRLCECLETWNWNQSPRAARGECKEPFSRPARLRMLREIAQIDWRDDIRYSLITLTYPDRAIARSVARQTVDRSWFIRDLERLMCRPLGIMWRKEWKQRLTGVHKGQFAAHWHLLCWDTPWVDYRDIRSLWGKVLATGGPIATDVREASTGVCAAHYAAKYAAKPSSCSLDYASYLNRGWGRAWGFCRKGRISYYEPTIIRGLSPDELALARQLAAGVWKGVARVGDGGFTLFGDAGPAIARSVLKMRMANRRRAV